MRIASRLASISESTTLAITARAAELKAQGRDVISLAAGEPDFPTPAPIAEAGIAAIRQGRTRYTATAGVPELRRAVAESLRRDYGLDYRANEVCVTAGTKPAIWLALAALLEPGEVVLVPAPYWVSYPAIVSLAGGVPRVLDTHEEAGFLPEPDELERALAERDVRGILLNSPCNPTGAVWPEARLAHLVETCARHDRWIVSDEIYADICYLDRPARSPAAMPGGREHTIVLNGLSKSCSMTGWRLGYMAGPEPVVAAATRAQSQLIGNACTISQYAALRALAAEGHADVKDARAAMVEQFARRRGFLVRALGELPRLTVRAPQGAFYVFPGVRAICAHLGCDDVSLAQRLLEEIGVATVPGSAFGKSGYLRLSFAASMDDLERAVDRLGEWLRT